jgi:hypothetical protein
LQVYTKPASLDVDKTSVFQSKCNLNIKKIVHISVTDIRPTEEKQKLYKYSRLQTTTNSQKKMYFRTCRCRKIGVQHIQNPFLISIQNNKGNKYEKYQVKNQLSKVLTQKQPINQF